MKKLECYTIDYQESNEERGAQNIFLSSSFNFMTQDKPTFWNTKLVTKPVMTSYIGYLSNSHPKNKCVPFISRASGTFLWKLFVPYQILILNIEDHFKNDCKISECYFILFDLCITTIWKGNHIMPSQML